MGEVRELFDRILNVLFPKDIKCIFCGEEVNENEFAICDKCNKEIERCEKICQRCGAIVKSESKYCQTCLNISREFDFARAPFVYKGNVVNVVHKFKYNNERYLASSMAEMMIDSFHKLEKLIGKFDYIIPVPMHKDKLKKRRYNQAKLLADEVGKLVDLEVEDNLVVKSVNTDSQTALTRKERFRNMLNVFELTDKHKVKSKNILIVDDVLTSGATTESISKLLKKNHANKIGVLTFARTNFE